MITQGPLDEIKFRNLANDSAGAGTEYPLVVSPFQETKMLPVHAAGYDLHDNYISDIEGLWTVTNLTGQISITPASGLATKVDALAIAQGTSNLRIDVAESADHPSKSRTIAFEVMAAPAKSFKLTLVKSGCNLEDATNVVNPVEVKAGDPFKLCVEAMTENNGEGAVATSYTGDQILLFSAVNAISSTLGFSWQRPTPDAAPNFYRFSNGKAVLSGGVLTGIPEVSSGNIVFVINDTTAGISGSLTIKNTLNSAGYVRSRFGSTADAEELSDGDEFPAADSMTLHGHVYDRGGNYLRLLTPAEASVWQYEAALPTSPMDLRPGLENPDKLGIWVSSLSLLNPVNFVPRETTAIKG